MEGYSPGAIWAATEFDEIQVREVYSRYGLAMYMAQVLEHGMINAAMVLRTLPTLRSHADEASWQAAFDRTYDTDLGRTYGNMLRQLDAITEFPRPLLTRLRCAKEDRDVLAHRFFRQHDTAFMHRNGRTAMIAWCEDRVELFQSLSDEIDAFILPIAERSGITREWIDSMMQQSMNDDRNWSPDKPHVV